MELKTIVQAIKIPRLMLTVKSENIRTRNPMATESAFSKMARPTERTV